jgi:short-subunit dehydrogenase
MTDTSPGTALITGASSGIGATYADRLAYVQAVLPSATRTEFWVRSGRDVDALQGAMDVGELVDAALVGFDRRETVTIPPLPDAGQWESFLAARRAMAPNFGNAHPAERYRACAPFNARRCARRTPRSPARRGRDPRDAGNGRHRQKGRDRAR